MNIQLPALAASAALILPAVPLLWKSGSLKADMNAKWRDRILIAHAGLAEQAVALLRTIQQDMERILGAPDQGFAPDLALADPALLAKSVARFQKALRYRDRLKSQFNLLISLCAAAPVLTFVYVLAGVGAALYFTSVYHVRWLGIVLFCIALGAATMGLLLTVAYVWVSKNLTRAEIHSQSDFDDTTEPPASKDRDAE